MKNNLEEKTEKSLGISESKKTNYDPLIAGGLILLSTFIFYFSLDKNEDNLYPISLVGLNLAAGGYLIGNFFYNKYKENLGQIKKWKTM